MTTEDKKGFIVYKDWETDFAEMSMEERGMVITAIFAFQNSGEITDFKDRFLNSILRKFIGIFQYDNDKWVVINKKRSEYGKLGGAPKGNTNAKKQPKNNLKQAENNLKQAENKPKQAKQAKQPVNSKWEIDNGEELIDNGNRTMDNSTSPPSDVFSLCESYQGSMLSPSQIENIKEWTVSADMVEYAISIAKDHNVYSLAYIGKIIQRWQNEKIKTVADARNDAARFGQRGKLTQNREYKGEFYDDNCPDDLFELELEVLSAANNHS